jgi:beta-aspartyl-peptidase (threonine type)
VRRAFWTAEQASHVLHAAIHGGAGEIKHTETINDRLAEFKKILQAGKKLLAEGRTAVQVAEEVTCLLEDCPWFNAGRGSVFTNSGTQEMDASIMDGSTLNAGACAAVCTIKNPIKLARVRTHKKTSPAPQPFSFPPSFLQ